MSLSFEPVLHSLAGIPIAQPGIFDGLLSPPTRAHASLVFILLSPLVYRILYHYNVFLSSLPLVACSLRLGACSSGPGLLTSASVGPGSGPFQARIFYNILYSSVSGSEKRLAVLAWSSFTRRRTSSNASAILFNCVSFIIIPFNIILYYPDPAVKRLLLGAWSFYPLRLLIRELGAPWCYTHC